jgi:predicted Zn-dependent protease
MPSKSKRERCRLDLLWTLFAAAPLNRLLAISRVSFAVLFLSFAEVVAHSAAWANIIALPRVHDTELEFLVRDLSRPILESAGLKPNHLVVHIFQREEGAFFTFDGHEIFLTTGTIIKRKNARQFIALICHQIAHLALGHLSDFKTTILAHRTPTVLALGPPTYPWLIGTFPFSLQPVDPVPRRYQLEQEIEADALASKLMVSVGASPEDLLWLLEEQEKQQHMPEKYRDAYFLLHPFSETRLSKHKTGSAVDGSAAHSFQLRYELARAKSISLDARAVVPNYTPGDTSLPARYARALAQSSAPAAILQLNELASEHPSNPFFLEAKANFLRQQGHVVETIVPLQKALELLGNPVFAPARIELARAMIRTNDAKLRKRAIADLEAMARLEDRATIHQLLASAYSQEKGRAGDAKLASALGLLYSGNFALARTIAEEVKKSYPRGSSNWTKADLVLEFASKGR